MTDLRTAAQQALEALEKLVVGSEYEEAVEAERAMDALRAALAEPVQEPYCYVYEYDSPYGLHREFYPREYNGMKPSRTVPLYAAPPQRKPLTDEEIKALIDSVDGLGIGRHVMHKVARSMERAHGIGANNE